MGAYLITGRSGTGKTTLCRELQKRGFAAYDGDKVPGLAGWHEKTTGKNIGKRYPGDDKLHLFEWNWDKTVLQTLLTQSSDVYLCGSAHNDTAFYDLFEQVFVLDVPEDEQRKRITGRIEHDYGKDAAVQNSIIAEQARLVRYARLHGAIILSALPDPTAIVNNIMEIIKDDSR